MSFVEVKDIRKSYGKKEILKGASFVADRGECVALVGANGCGKSTLLGVLAGTLKAASGEILYNGENPFENKKVFQKYVGYVPQENPLMDKLSVYDNLRFWYCDTDRKLDEDMQNGILKEFGLDVYRNYSVNKLSGGLKKRLSIACALAANPQVLIMDEPGAALDVICKEDIKHYLLKYMKKGGTVLLTSHEEAELAICSRMYLLKDGMLTELLDKPVGSVLMERLK